MSCLPNNTHASPDVELYLKAGPQISGIQTVFDPLVILNSDPNSNRALVVDVGNTRVDYEQVNVSSGVFTDPTSQITQTTASNTPGIIGQPAIEFTINPSVNMPELSITSSAVRVANDLFLTNPGTTNYLDIRKTAGASALIQNVGPQYTNRIDFDANSNIRLNSTIQISSVGVGLDILDGQNNINRTKISPSSVTFWTNNVERGGLINDGTNLRLGQNPTQSAILINPTDQAVINASSITGTAGSVISTNILNTQVANIGAEVAGTTSANNITASTINATNFNITNAIVSTINCDTLNGNNIIASTILYYGAITDANITNAFQTNPSTNTLSVIGGVKLQGGSVCSGKQYAATIINGGLPNYVDCLIEIKKPCMLTVNVAMDPLTVNPNNITSWGTAMFYTYYQAAGNGNVNLNWGAHYNNGQNINIFLSTIPVSFPDPPQILNGLDLIVQNGTGQTQQTVQYEVAWTIFNRYDANEYAT